MAQHWALRQRRGRNKAGVWFEFVCKCCSKTQPPQNVQHSCFCLQKIVGCVSISQPIVHGRVCVCVWIIHHTLLKLGLGYVRRVMEQCRQNAVFTCRDMSALKNADWCASTSTLAEVVSKALWQRHWCTDVSFVILLLPPTTWPPPSSPVALEHSRLHPTSFQQNVHSRHLHNDNNIIVKLLFIYLFKYFINTRLLFVFSPPSFSSDGSRSKRYEPVG